MKTKLYLYGCVLSAAVLLSASGNVSGQCNCPGGTPATEVITPVEFMYPTPAANYSLFFPKFDPAIGTLTCVKVTATLQGKSTGTGTITDGSDEFKWLISTTPKITLPTTSVSKTFTDTYGPDTLATTHWKDSVNALFPDSIHYNQSVTHGPIDLFVNESFVAKGPASAAYLGDPATKVEVKFSIFGFFVPTEGGINYNTTISTSTSGSFYMYYYWCPAGVLAKNIRDFTSVLKNDYVQIGWVSDNQVGNITYEVQVSTDGTNYKTVYALPSLPSGGGSNNYQYLYNIPGGAGERLYVRIKQTEPSGKVTYSKVNKVTLSELESVKNLVSVFPNPAIDKVSLEFQNEMNGDFAIDVVTVTGQKIFNRDIKIVKSKTATVNLNNPPRTGMYYLRATDKRTGSVYVNKLFMK